MNNHLPPIVTTNPDYIEPPVQPKSSQTTGTIKRTNISALLFEQVITRYEKELCNGTFVSPLSYWVDVLNDENSTSEARDKAAMLVAKYMHRAMPTETEIKQEITSPSFQISFIGQDAE